MAVLPSLLGYAKSNPGASEGDMVKYLTLMNAQFTQGLELAKSMNPNPGSSETDMIKYLTLMDGQFSKGMEIARAMNPGQPDDSLMKAVMTIKELMPFIQPFLRDPSANQGMFEQLIKNPDTLGHMEKLFGGGSSEKNQFDLDIEKLRGEREMDGRKWDLQLRKDALQSQERQNLTDTIANLIGPVAAALSGPVAQRVQQIGAQQASTHPNPDFIQNPAPNPAPPTGTTIL
ncbi:unnamed protein product, partial [marine sediment metagenome]